MKCGEERRWTLSGSLGENNLDSPPSTQCSTWPLPLDKPMLTKVNNRVPPTASKSWLIGCTIHLQSPASPHMVTMWLNRSPMMMMLDLRSTITLVWTSTLPKALQTCSNLAVTCVWGCLRGSCTLDMNLRLLRLAAVASGA